MKYIQNIVNVKNELIFTIRNCIEKRCGKMKLTSLKNNEKIFRTENIFLLFFHLSGTWRFHWLFWTSLIFFMYSHCCKNMLKWILVIFDFCLSQTWSTYIAAFYSLLAYVLYLNKKYNFYVFLFLSSTSSMRQMLRATHI